MKLALKVFSEDINLFITEKLLKNSNLENADKKYFINFKTSYQSQPACF